MKEDQLENQIEYYRLRVPEYNKLYHKPERQDDLKLLGDHILSLSANRKVLELGCGTGYWTALMESNAEKIIATDFNDDMIEQAKKVCSDKVDFRQLDYFKVHTLNDDFDMIYGGFIFSHIPLQTLKSWIVSMIDPYRKRVFVFTDNTFVASSSTTIAETDSFGNTYQKRAIGDDQEFLVMKNYFSEEKLNEFLPDRAGEVNHYRTTYYWLWSFVA